MAGDAVQTGTQQKARVTVTKDGMRAMLVIFPSAPGDAAPVLADITGALERVGVVFGIDHDIIAASLRDAVYNTPIAAAVGTPPKKGSDSIHSYTFDANNTGRTLDPISVTRRQDPDLQVVQIASPAFASPAFSASPSCSSASAPASPANRIRPKPASTRPAWPGIRAITSRR